MALLKVGIQDIQKWLAARYPKGAPLKPLRDMTETELKEAAEHFFGKSPLTLAEAVRVIAKLVGATGYDDYGINPYFKAQKLEGHSASNAPHVHRPLWDGDV
jgi:hypothetical protein